MNYLILWLSLFYIVDGQNLFYSKQNYLNQGNNANQRLGQYFPNQGNGQFNPNQGHLQFYPNQANGQFSFKQGHEQYYPNEKHEQFNPNRANGQFYTKQEQGQYYPNQANGQFYTKQEQGKFHSYQANRQFIPKQEHGQYYPNQANEQFNPKQEYGQYYTYQANGHFNPNPRHGQFNPNQAHESINRYNSGMMNDVKPNQDRLQSLHNNYYEKSYFYMQNYLRYQDKKINQLETRLRELLADAKLPQDPPKPQTVYVPYAVPYPVPYPVICQQPRYIITLYNNTAPKETEINKPKIDDFSNQNFDFTKYIENQPKTITTTPQSNYVEESTLLFDNVDIYDDEEEKDNHQEGNRPISFDAVEPEEPIPQPPPVEHGSFQGGE